MKNLKNIVLLILLLHVGLLWGRGHIVYLCFDPKTCSARPIIDKLEQWRNEGDLFLYIQKRDNSIVEIKTEDDFDSYVAYLESTGINGGRPSKITIEEFNRDLIGVLNEKVRLEKDTPILSGEMDDSYSIEIILPKAIINNPDDYKWIRRMIAIDELEQRCSVNIWESSSKITKR